MTRRNWSLLVAVVATVCLWLQWRPLRLPTTQNGAPAVMPWRQDGHSLLLLVPAKRAASADAFSPSLEWSNLLEQRFGACDVAAISELDAQLLRGRLLIVLPRRSLAEMDSSAAPLLDAAVEAGAQMLLEAPSGFWSRRLGLPAQGLEWRERLPWPHPGREARRSESLLLDPNPLPLRHHAESYWPRRGELGLARSVGSPAGRPLLWALDRGRGRWLVLSLDFAELASLLRQGRPDDDGRISDRNGDGLLATEDLLLSSDLASSDHAWLDRWLQAILNGEVGRTPWPRMWPVTFDADGFLLLAHDLRDGDPSGNWMGRAEQDWGMPSTLFQAAVSPFEATPSGNLIDRGLLGRWPSGATWREAVGSRRLLGLGAFRPLGRLPSIAAQRDSLGLEERVHRMQDSQWSRRPDTAFEVLAAAGFDLDLSFAPSPPNAGWLFGSGSPFRPISSDGRQHRIHELPLLGIDDESGLDPERVRRWLRGNSEGGHGVVGLGLPPASHSDAPSAARFEFWQDLPNLAQKTRHRAVSASQLIDFWNRRRAVRWAMLQEGEWLRIEILPPAQESSTDALPLALALPQRWQGRSLVAWEADWPNARARRSSSYGEAELLLELPPQSGLLRVRYAGP